MLEGKRRVNKNKIISKSDTKDEVLLIAELRKEKELLNRANNELSASLDSKRKSLNLDYKTCKKIEDEHFAKIDKAQEEYFSLVAKVSEKNKEFKDFNTMISNLSQLKTSLEQTIPKLEETKLKLSEEIESMTYSHNIDKKNSEAYINNLREQISELNNEYLSISGKLLIAKDELKATFDRTLEENKLIARRQRDIDIYEARFRAKNKDKTIILANNK